MKRVSIFAALLAFLLLGECRFGAWAATAAPQPAQNAATAAGPSTLDYAGTTARHPASVAAGLSAPATVTVRPGDTYGGWALRYCGTFSAWHAIQAVNGWPERAIPVGATARIVCTTVSTDPTRSPVTTASWMHPLASGKHGNSCYGWRASTGSFHGGVDMAQPRGTVIRAASAGVIFLKRSQPGGAGFYLVIRHPRNTFTLYAHMIAPSSLGVGAVVVAGQAIGRVGATGNATGPHLHFEVQTGGYGNSHRINPAPFMRERGVNIGC